MTHHPLSNCLDHSVLRRLPRPRWPQMPSFGCLAWNLAGSQGQSSRRPPNETPPACSRLRPSCCSYQRPPLSVPPGDTILHLWEWRLEARFSRLQRPAPPQRQHGEAQGEEEGGREFWNGDCCWDRGQQRSRAGTATFACKLTPPPMMLIRSKPSSTRPEHPFDVQAA